MKCAKCGSEMIDGQTHIGTSMAVGLSLANLTFKADKWAEHILQDISDVLAAHYCDKCGGFTIETKRRGLSTLES